MSRNKWLAALKNSRRSIARYCRQFPRWASLAPMSPLCAWNSAFARWLRQPELARKIFPSRQSQSYICRNPTLASEALEQRCLLNAGSLDLGFGDNGVAATDLFNSGGHGFALQSNGVETIWAAGYLGGIEGFGLAKYSADGTPDASFGVGGLATYAILPGITIDELGAQKMAVQPDGKILVGAGSRGSWIARINPDGSLDDGSLADTSLGDSFGSTGVQRLSGSRVTGIVIQSDGKIVGLTRADRSRGFIIERFNFDGTLDDGGVLDSTPGDQFGVAGSVELPFSDDNVSQGIAIQTIGGVEKLVVAGYAKAESFTDLDIVLVRLNLNGTYDQEFGTGGTVFTDVLGLDHHDVAQGIAVQADGRIVIAGNESPSGQQFLLRYNVDGSLDASFDSDGIVSASTEGGFSQLNALSIQSDGKIVAAGSSSQSGTSHYALARYNNNGSLDDSFGISGVVTSAIGESLVGLASQDDGKIVAIGHDASQHLSMVRFFGGVYAGIERSPAGSLLEGSSLTLSGTIAGVDPATVNYQWIITGDSSTYVVQSPTTTGQTLDLSLLDDATLSVQLNVSDVGGLVATHSAIINVGNIAPNATLGTPQPSYKKATELFKATFNVGDAGANDPLTALADFDDLLGFVSVPIQNNKVVLEHPYSFNNQAFTKQITLQVSDGIDIANVTLLLVVGSNGSDTITVDYGSTIVTVNGQAPVTFDPNGGLFLFGMDGDDTITVDPNITLDTVLDGGEGNDTLQGGGGNNYYFGDSGFDAVIAATGDNTLLDAVEQFVIADPNALDVAISQTDVLSLTTALFENPLAGEINWGDGTVDNATVNTVAGILSGSHVYANDGLFLVHVTMTEPSFQQFELWVSVNAEEIAPPIAQSSTIQVIENSAEGTAVGVALASSPSGSPLTYQLIGGTGNNAFTMDPLTGQISVLDSSLLDFETTPELTLEFEVSDDAGQTASATITIQLLNQASITGSVFVDVNGNGLFNANEPGIDGVTVELLDASGNAVLDDNNNPIRAVTSDGGFYLFEDLDPAAYRLREIDPTGVNDGAEILGSLGGTIVANDVMAVTLARNDAADYDFAELGQSLTSGDTAGIGFWQNKHGQALIAQGGSALAAWLSANFGNVFGNAFADGYGDDGFEVASFYKNELFKRKSTKSAGPAKVDAQFMATALATFFTSSNLAGTVADSYGFNVSQTGIGTSVVNVGNSGAAFGVANGTSMTIMQLLLATNSLTDQPENLSGAANIYDFDGNGLINSYEAWLRELANQVYSQINGL